MMRKKSDHETTFLREMTEANPDGYLESLVLFDNYDAWAKRRRNFSVGYDRFMEAVQRVYPNAVSQRIRIDGRRPTVICGIDWA